MRRIAAYLISIAATAVLGGCTGDEVPVGDTSVNIGEYGNIPCDGGEFSIPYDITNPFKYGILRARTDSEWITSVVCEESQIVVTAASNEAEAARQAVLVITYPECDPLEITLEQDGLDNETRELIDIEVEMKDARTATARFTPRDESRPYYTGCLPSYRIPGDRGSFISSVLDSLKAEAESKGQSLETVIGRYVSTSGTDKEFGNLQAESSYTVFAFGLSADGTAAGILNTAEIRTGAFEQPSLTFDLEKLDVSRTTLTVRCTPSADGFHYIYHNSAEDEFNTVYGNDDSRLIIEMIEECRRDLEYYNSSGLSFTFWDFCDTGIKERTFKRLLPDTRYHIFAFALTEDGFALSPASREVYVTAKDEITDDCTFTMSFSDIRSDSFDVTVIPSDKSTRYYAYLADSKILDSYSKEEVAALMISMANDSGINWSDSPYVFTGDRTLDSYNDLGSPLLAAESSYTVFVFGVNGYGERTTEVATAECITAQVEQSDMTIAFSIEVGGPSSADITYRPSKDESYFYGCVTKARYEDAASDKDFITGIIADSEQEGTFIPVRGEKLHQLRGNYLRAGTEYVAYAFGYAGAVTTPLFIETFTTPERVFSDASMTITYTIRDGNELYEENPGLNFSYKNRAAVTFHVEPVNTGSWFFSGFGNSKSYLEALDQEELLYVIETNGRKNYNKRQVTYAVDWNSRICCAGFGEDSHGNEGRPVIIEAIVPGKTDK